MGLKEDWMRRLRTRAGHSQSLQPESEPCEAYIKEALEIDRKGSTLLHWAAEQRQLELLEYLLPHIPSSALLVQDESGRTPLLAAMKRSKSASKAKVVELLWNATSEEGRRLKDSKKGRTALHWMVLSMRGLSQANVLCDLLSRATVEELMEKDKDGNTVLHCAAMIKTYYETEGDWAPRMGPEERERKEQEPHASKMVMIALQSMLPLDRLRAINNNGQTALHLAAMHGNNTGVMTMIGRLDEEDIIRSDNNGHSFFHGMFECGTIQSLDTLAPLITISVLERIPEIDFSAIWRGSDPTHAQSQLDSCSKAAMEVIVRRTPEDMLRECSWLEKFVYSAVMWGRFRLSLLLMKKLDRSYSDERLKDTYFFNCDEVAIRLTECWREISDEDDLEAGLEIVSLLPDVSFSRGNGDLLGMAANQSSNPKVFAGILRRTPRDIVYSRERFNNLSHAGNQERLKTILAAMEASERYDGMLIPILSRQLLTPEFIRFLMETFPREMFLQKNSDGQTALHLLVRGRMPRASCIRALVTAVPELRAMRNAEGQTAAEFAREKRIRDILTPLVKKAE